MNQNFLGTPFGCYTKAKACESNFHRAADWQLGEPMWVASFSRGLRASVRISIAVREALLHFRHGQLQKCLRCRSPLRLQQTLRMSHALPSLEAFLAGRIMAAHLLAIDSHFQDSPVADHGIHHQTGPHQNPVFEVLAKAGILSTLRLHLQVVNEFAPFTVKVEENQED